MELLQYALHLNTEKIKVNRFVFSLNGNIRAKVRIQMPQNLHDVIQKALIAEEELISGGHSRTLARLVGKVSSCAQQHQTPAMISWLPEGIHFHYTLVTNALTKDTLSGTTPSATTSIIAAAV
jgi:hypothetical protein